MSGGRGTPWGQAMWVVSLHPMWLQGHLGPQDVPASGPNSWWLPLLNLCFLILHRTSFILSVDVYFQTVALKTND